ncbi:MAG: serpin family protein [Trebonia sp.]
MTAAVAGCGATSTPATTHATDVVMVRGVAAVEPAANPKPFGAADTAFGLDVMRAWCAQNPGRNLVFSPSTLASALGLAYLGARGATAAEMAKVLHLPASSRAALAAGLQARLKALSSLDSPGVTVAASDQVWTDPTLTTLRSYLDDVATGYGAGVAKAPFSTDPAKAAAEINAAISAATRGHIAQLVDAGMLSRIGWVLTSALYLDAKWATAFDANETDPAVFTPASGKPVTVPFMNGDAFRYVTAGGWQAVSLPYRGGKLTMTALLPPARSGGCALPGAAALAGITESLAGARPFAGKGMGPAYGTADVSLPKVSLDTSGGAGNMEPVLERLGMGQAFTGSADFTGLSREACCIGFVQQAATLQVGEKGTVGAAAAAVGMEPALAIAVPQTITITFNRPYVLLVSAKATGEPLFLATVANPADS